MSDQVRMSDMTLSGVSEINISRDSDGNIIYIAFSRTTGKKYLQSRTQIMCFPPDDETVIVRVNDKLVEVEPEAVEEESEPVE